MAETAQSDEVHLFRIISRNLYVFLLFCPNFRNINIILYYRVLRICQPGAPEKRLPDRFGAGDKPVVILQLSLEEMPEHPIFPFILQLDLHVVVQPHYTFFCPHAECSARTGELVAVEVCCEIKFSILFPVNLPEAACRFKRQKTADPRRRLHKMNRQRLGKTAREKAALFKNKECHIHPLIIQVMEEIKEALFNSARPEAALEKDNSLFHVPPFSGRRSRRYRKFQTG